MKNHHRIRQAVVLTVGAVALASPLLSFASAQDIKDIAQNVTGNFSAVSRFVTGGAYVLGAFGIVHGLHKFWQKSHDQGNQIKAQHYGIPIIAGGMLIAFAAAAGVPVATLFGGSTSTTGDSGTTTY
jgi:uncharacterized membrane protein